ncbi:MAG: hypothetical protein HQL34_03770 [Alphaproteobacteria bacterium]|nr:hypothetical protein [Alphaproteobacteria bacterium]
MNAKYSGIKLDIDVNQRSWFGGIGLSRVERLGNISFFGSLEYSLDSLALEAAAKSASNGGTTLSFPGMDQSGTSHTGTLQLRAGYDIDAFTPYFKGALNATTTDKPGEKGRGGGELALGVDYRISGDFAGSVEGFKGFEGGNNPGSAGAELNLRLRF